MKPATQMAVGAAFVVFGWVLAALGAVLLFSGCAPARSLTREETRNVIHARHNMCMDRVNRETALWGFNAMSAFWCDEEQERECKAAGLERGCSAWQWGGT